MLDVRSLSFRYGESTVLNHVSFRAGEGEIIALLGPNGVGKSTLFRCLLGFLKPQKGSLLLNGKELADYSQKELAGRIAYIPQSYSPAFGHTVLDSVLMGVTARLSIFQEPGEEEINLAMEKLSLLGIGHLKERSALRISGGERQLMLLARALVQNASMLLMDEPTANLDYGNSYRVMEQIAALKAQGYTVIFSTHDPNQAYRYATRVITLKGGTILSDGSPEETLTPAVLSALYGVAVHVADLEVDGTIYKACVPSPAAAAFADTPQQKEGERK